MGYLKSAIIGITLAMPFAASAQNVHCDDLDTVMSAFEEQGTVYRGTAEGPNHNTVHVFENVATGRGIAVKIDEENSLVCAEAAGFDYQAFTARALVNPPVRSWQ